MVTEDKKEEDLPVLADKAYTRCRYINQRKVELEYMLKSLSFSIKKQVIPCKRDKSAQNPKKRIKGQKILEVN